MISKRIDRKNNTSDFERLGCYILEAKSKQDTILWTSADDFKETFPSTNGKVLSYRITNCEAEVPAMAMTEVILIQARNTRSKADKTYHLVISFPDGEVPTPAQLLDIEDEFCKALGFVEHQRISAVHQDTDNLHLHIAINKVHPQSFKVIEPYRDFYILSQTCRQLEQRHGLQVDNGIEQSKGKEKSGQSKASDVQEPFLKWIQETLRTSLTEHLAQAEGWSELHQYLSPYGLTIKPRGAGLVIGLTDGSLTVKASDVLKALSYQKLTNRWGAYQPPRSDLVNRAKPELCYPKASFPVHSLWDQYQQHKAVVMVHRTEAYSHLRDEHETYTQQLKAWYRKRHESLKANSLLTVKSKRGLRQQLYREQKADFTNRKRQEVQQRQLIREQFPILNWDQWLKEQANQGNLSALGMLRGRSRVRQRVAQALLTVNNLEEAKVIIYPELKPRIRKNGDLVYRLKDGGLVEDTTKAIFVSEVTEAATVLALLLAQERFPGQALIIKGSEEFKQKVIQMAGDQAPSLRLQGPNLEQTRSSYIEP